MELFNIIIRTLFFYFFITLSYRIMGKREIGQLGIIDLIVSILIAEMVAISIENNTDPMYLTIVPIGVLVCLEVFLAYLSTKSSHLRVLLEGKPSLIISNGKVNYHEMIKQRYTLDDLLLQLRNKSIKNLLNLEIIYIIDKDSKPRDNVTHRKPLNLEEDLVGITICIPQGESSTNGMYVSIDMSDCENVDSGDIEDGN